MEEEEDGEEERRAFERGEKRRIKGREKEREITHKGERDAGVH